MKNLASALIKAQADMAPLLKSADNPHLKSKYATLAGVQDACLPALGKHDIAVMQSVSTDWVDANNVLVKVGCTLFHSASGEFVINEISLRPVKSDPQGIGSAITYGRRYLLMTMAGLAPEDDDGNAASGQAEAKKTAQTQRTSASAPTPANSHANGTTTLSSDQAMSIVGEAFVSKAIESWKAPADAFNWAADGGFTDNEHSARTRWAEIVKTDFGNQCNTSNINAVMRAYATHYFNKQAARVAA